MEVFYIAGRDPYVAEQERQEKRARTLRTAHNLMDAAGGFFRFGFGGKRGKTISRKRGKRVSRASRTRSSRRSRHPKRRRA